MPLCSVETALDDLKKGRMIILVDDEDRENEGDLVAAAEFVTPEIINFMSREGRGLICLSLSAERADALNLPLMTRRNGSKFGTNFTVSIDAACVKTSLLTALQATGNAGRVITMGFSVAPTEVNQFVITSKELDVRGSRLQNRKFQDVIDLINAGKVDLRGSISHTFPLTEAQKAFDFVDSRDPSIRKIAFTFDF